MDPLKDFQKQRREAIAKMANDDELKQKSLNWMLHADRYKYSYNFSWLGCPIIKFPNDIVALQEIIWRVKPDYIVETGIAQGGSIIFSASMLELLGHGHVIGVDIDIWENSRKRIEEHAMFKRITMYEGSSTDPKLFATIQKQVHGHKVLVCLDSLHTHEHVLAELNMYQQIVPVGSYIICPDTIIEYFPPGYYENRPWDVGNNTMTAVNEFLRNNENFVVDHDINDKLMITEGLDGYLKRVK